MGKRINQDRLCSVSRCGRVHRARGYCSLHWQRWRHNLPMDRPIYYNRKAKKGWISAGYRWISTEDRGEIQEHIYKMEKHLGRRLKSNELVHHKNEDKLDNRLSNLQLIDRGEHTSLHRAHRMPCLICGTDSEKGGHGLCGMHSARSRDFFKRFKVNIPESKWAKSFLFMSIELGLNSPEVAERLESLKLKGEF